MRWTAEELAVLKLRAGEGLSAGQIAQFLPGRSRNAVIGMLRRGEGKYGRLLGEPSNRAACAAQAVNHAPARLKPKPVRDFVGKLAVERVTEIPAMTPVDILFISPDCPGHARPLIGAVRSNPEAKASEDNGSTAISREEAGTAVTGDASRARGGAGTAPSNLPATLPMTFLQAALTDRCLYFVCDWYDPDGPDMPVCGAPRAANVVGTRYCRRHLAQRVQVAA